MKIISEQPLSDFHFWSGARNTAKHLDENDFEIIENMLEEIYSDGINETELNDFFWFEDDTIAELLGYDDFESLVSERKEEEREE